MRFGPPSSARPGVRRTARLRGRTALRSFVSRADDRLLERTFGTRAGLRLLLGLLGRSLSSAPAADLHGELCFELRAARGEVRSWTVDLGDGARVRPGAGREPRLTVELGLADLVRIAGGDLDAGTALLTGRLDLVGDVALAARLGELLD